MVNVRSATIEDYSGIKNVASKAWYDTYTNIYTASTVTAFLNASYSREMLEKRINDSDFFVAESDGKIVGFANFIKGTELYLSSHYVLPEAQRDGYGKALLYEGLNQYKDKYSEIYLEVDSKNEIGIQFYKKEGFVVLREYEELLFGDTMRTTLMKKTF
ncbi:GNAT family N-acetyltransferase [Mammaliicoccus stepanovicii]|uniref:GNAT family acetyltransferase n=1 Tax=Mammaliicoccus stepanovicii TaxID=643214 RepID=A0A240A7H9_9STAP|nr:GNAT family N-acetyltransferase [Mammaliicoccus stepanovicii]PNZ77172.1 GNAT family N-acetyltransferase [Mammaliicoccus stepanovicii]GGI39657.1 N-acetyltransferase [Mammaliicoccus stepanovicii]SNV79297.1 GNAT family acetyltransferase [Mammaliicoccus stepanovicii]